jgi:hypothetical protein
MVITQKDRVVADADPIVESVRDAEELLLESVQKFVSTVNSIVADVRDDPLRRKIIDTGVEMTKHMVGTSSELAQKIVTAASDAWVQPKSGTEPQQ